MNVLVLNEQQNQLQNIEVDIIKSITGSFQASELIALFKDFFYNKMILDVTALKDYNNPETYKELVEGLNPDKVIFFLPEGSDLCTSGFLSRLITYGIYNFTTNIEGVIYLINNSNTYKDVEHIQKMGEGEETVGGTPEGYTPVPMEQVTPPPMEPSREQEVQRLAQEEPMPTPPPMVVQEPEPIEQQTPQPTHTPLEGVFYQKVSMHLDRPQQQSFQQPTPQPVQQQMFQQPMQQTIQQQMNQQPMNQPQQNIVNALVIGVQNVTDHAGATSLVYMMKKELSSMYGQGVYAIEVEKNDFLAYNDKQMISETADDLAKTIRKMGDAKIIFVDLNGHDLSNVCHDIIYLIEPSIIKLHSLMQRNKSIIAMLRGKKVVLNKSLLTQKEVQEFEYESGLQIKYNMPPLNDRKRNEIIIDFMQRCNIISNNNSSGSQSGIFGLFRK